MGYKHLNKIYTFLYAIVPRHLRKKIHDLKHIIRFKKTMEIIRLKNTMED